MQYNKNSGLLISVVLCTYNRAQLFADALKTLCEQICESSLYEVIVVDNNSQDSTRGIAESYRRDYPNIKYFLEPRQGLSHARNRGWQEAKGLYVAYVDDDCKVPAQWLTIAMEIIDQIAPAAFGGPYYAFYNSPKPTWWKDRYGAFEQSQEPRPLRQLEYLRGGNIFFRRKVLEDINGFTAGLGMSEKKLGYGEETELQRRIRATLLDELIYYVPKLYVFHLMRLEKMTLRWNLLSHFIGGRYSYHVFRENTPKETGKQPLILLFQALKTLLRFVVDILVGVLWRDRRRYPYIQNYLFENTFQYMGNLGLIYEQFTH